MCMDAAAHVRLPAPSFSVRIHNQTPDEFLLRACELARLGTGVPAMYNDEAIIPALCNRGLTLADARNSVSYTHLDVYKRQVYSSNIQNAGFLFWQNIRL